MALFQQHYKLIFFTLIASLSLHINPSHSFKPKNFNITSLKHRKLTNNDWSDAGATWYGEPNGAGSNGGACGYTDSVEKSPFNKMISAGGPSLFIGGKGCGTCYEIKCSSNKLCSNNPITIVITDSCPGCTTESVHFDLSGTAFGAMAISGQQSQLRNAGVLPVQYRRVNCNYHGKPITFKVDSGSNPYYFATLIEYVDGDGDLGEVELKQALDTDSWLPMQQSWGAVWKLDYGSGLRAPFSIRLKSRRSGDTITATNVIPAGWVPGREYTSHVNF